MTEKNFWGRVRENLKPYGELERIESLVGSGVPDVNYCLRGREGWIELKWLPRWPKRVSSLVRFPKLKLTQVLWLERRRRVEGRAFLLAQVEHDILLFDGCDARLVYDGLDRDGLCRIALVHTPVKFPTQEILRCLVADA